MNSKDFNLNQIIYKDCPKSLWIRNYGHIPCHMKILRRPSILTRWVYQEAMPPIFSTWREAQSQRLYQASMVKVKEAIKQTVFLAIVIGLLIWAFI